MIFYLQYSDSDKIDRDMETRLNRPRIQDVSVPLISGILLIFQTLGKRK